MWRRITITFQISLEHLEVGSEFCSKSKDFSWQLHKITQSYILPKKTFFDLCQCFSTGVPRRTSVPLIFSGCAAKPFNKCPRKNAKKQQYVLHFSFFTPRCAANFVFKISVPQTQKSWEPLIYAIKCLFLFSPLQIWKECKIFFFKFIELRVT